LSVAFAKEDSAETASEVLLARSPRFRLTESGHGRGAGKRQQGDEDAHGETDTAQQGYAKQLQPSGLSGHVGGQDEA
jgi:hypothetical protein